MKEKHIVVNVDTHKRAKQQALSRDMTLKQYIEFLLNMDKKDNK